MLRCKSTSFCKPPTSLDISSSAAGPVCHGITTELLFVLQISVVQTFLFPVLKVLRESFSHFPVSDDGTADLAEDAVF